MIGIDLDRVHRLSPTPTKEEVASAMKYLDGVNQEFMRLEFGE